ncbi:MAG: glycosyltransferase [Candidatus Lokiarchaeota archaeon]|nr:glycosyltransferase [Candidatus Lokiarchaeota archaeon]
MKISIITSNYPYSARPYYGTFVQNLVRNFSLSGISCDVIRPLSIFDSRYGKLPSLLMYDNTLARKSNIKIWTPKYFSASAKKICMFNTAAISNFNYARAVRKILNRLKPFPNILYGHFLYPSGALAIKLASEFGLPSIVAVGDSQLKEYLNDLEIDKLENDFKNVSGVIAVSQYNKRFCVEHLRIPQERIRVFPNGIDHSTFFPRDRMEMRKKYNLPTNKFIIAFTGHFIKRKGADRVLQAINELKEIGILLIGAGPMNLESQNILFKGFLKQELVPEMLSAADIFVLPTEAEGSCNSMLEAMACGLPIVTSNIDENKDIVDKNVSIMVNPNNVDEIRNAILTLKQNKQLRNEMSKNALLKSTQFDIRERANNILKWINEIYENFQNE